MPELTEQERADLWVKQRLHEAAVKETILIRMANNPETIQELVDDWLPVIAHLDERGGRCR